ncbi:AAR2-like protein [Elsinoe fawcettii]|nr:AAR2-like protein [Elsinoe fawcettii]
MDEISPALLLLDLPSQALCGVDLLSFTTTPSFKGIKSLPPGLHFIFTAPHSTLAVRHGAWFIIPDTNSLSPPALVLKQWDTTSETLRPVTDQATILTHRANLGSIWKTCMAPYRQRAGDHTSVDSLLPEANSFPGLTSYITTAYLSHVFDASEEQWHLTSYTDTFSSASTVPSVPSTQTYEPERPLHLLPIDLRRTWPPDSTGRARTDAARDRSWYLLDLCTRHTLSSSLSSSSPSQIHLPPGQPPRAQDLGPLSHLLAEMQFTFLTSLTLNNFSTLEQWRRSLRLVLACRSAIPAHAGFFCAFLALLQAQIQRLGSDSSSSPDPPLSSQGLLPPPSASSHPSSGPATGSTGKRNARKVISIEEQSESELLLYDLPVRSHRNQRSKKSLLAREAQREAEKAKEAEEMRAAAASEDELRTLFLEEEVDAEGRSFLLTLLVGFREGVEGLLRMGRGTLGDGQGDGAEGVKEVLRALGELEGTLFELYGWEFDEDISAAGREGVEGRDAAQRTLGRGLRDEEEDDDEDGEYAPAVVDLTQEQLTALGIEGTPSVKPIKSVAMTQREELGSGIVSQVVVEESDQEDEDRGLGGVDKEGDNDEGNGYGEDYDDMDIEEMDTRY